MRNNKTWTEKERDYIERCFFPSYNRLYYSAAELGRMFQRTTSAVLEKAAEMARKREDV